MTDPHRRDPGKARALGKLIARVLFVFSFCFYALTGPGHSSFADGFLSFLTARSVYREGHFWIDDLPSGGLQPGIDGKSYSVYGAGAALVMIPALAAGDWLPEILQPRLEGAPIEPLRRDEFWAALTNAAVMAVVVALVFSSAIELGASTGTALAIALSLAVASPLWPYARIDGSEALQALGLAGAFLCLVRSRRRPHSTFLFFAAGTLLATAIAAKLANLVCLPWLALMIVGRRNEAASVVRAASAFLAPIATVVALVAVYNQARFAGWFTTGYVFGDAFFSHPLLDGAIRLLFLPSYGLLFFWPGFALAIAGGVLFGRRWPLEAIAIAGVAVSLLVLHARFTIWWGACWGPRYLVPAVPLLALWVVPIASRRSVRAALLGATLLGIAVQLPVVTSSYRHQVLAAWLELRSPTPLALHTDPAIAPLRVGAWWLRQTIAERLGDEVGARELLDHPGWIDAFPWRRPGPEGHERLEKLRGLDLWAVPPSWKTKTYDYWRAPEDARPIPSDPALAALLALGAAVAAARLAQVLVDDYS